MDPKSSRTRQPARRRAFAAVISVGLHLLLPLLVLATRPPEPLAMFEPEPMTVTLVEPPRPPRPVAAAAPAGPAEPSPVTPAPPTPARAPPPIKVRPPVARPPATVPPLPITPSTAPPIPLATLSDAALVGARTAGSGQGGGGGGSGSGAGGQPCDMVRRLQGALRQDADIQAAVGRAHREDGTGKAILVWNGDWLRSPGQEGKGLAGVRQAIVMEVAFAPEPCRTEAMRGLVLISLADSPGAPRLVLGQNAWRWSDLLGARAVRRSAAFTP